LNPIGLIHAMRNRLRRAFPALLLAVVLGQSALLAHAMEHALEDGSPVCEVCTVSQGAADTAATVVVARLANTPDATPFLAVAPPTPRGRTASARDPPRFPLS
jgi:hypothetical protein